MKKIVTYIVLALIAAGCTSKPTAPVAATGELRFADFSIEVKDETQKSVITRAEAHQLEVKVVDVATNKIMASYSSHLSMPNTTVLPVGLYTVSVQTAAKLRPLSGVGFDAPIYAHQQTVEIKPAEIATITVVCKQESCGVTVGYTDLFKQVFPDNTIYHTTLMSSYGHIIDFISTETRTAHFEVPTHNMNIFYIVGLKKGDVELRDTMVMKDATGNEIFAAKQTNYSITVDL